MTITSKLPDVIDYLVTTFTAASTLGAAADPVAVYDGPVTTQERAKKRLWVGVDELSDDATDEIVAGSSDQQWTGPGNRQRDETVTVNLVAEAWGGVTDVATMRANVYGICAAVEDVIFADATLGGLISPGHANVSGGELRYAQTSTGMVCRVPFQIVCSQLRIGGAL